MKITLETYDPGWKQSFEEIKKKLEEAIGFLEPAIAHIGSTSVEGLSAKPIIDVLVGLRSWDDLQQVIRPLTDRGFVYYEVYNKTMPYRRFFVRHKVDPQELRVPRVISGVEEIPSDTFEHAQRLAHVHILPVDSHHWTRHVAFRDYLEAHPGVREQYQQLKEKLSEMEWPDGNDYNAAKNDFVKRVERNALEWNGRRKTDRSGT